MKRGTVFVALSAVCVGVSFAAPGAPPAEREPHAYPEELRQLVLTLEPTRARFLLYEPITIPYRIVNPTTMPLRATIPPNDEVSVVVTFVDSKGLGRAFRAGIGALTSWDERSYPPGTIKVGQREIDGFAVGEPGNYHVRAGMWVFFGSERAYIESNTIEIEVVPPSALDAQLIGAFESKEDFARLLSDWLGGYCWGADGPERFEALCKVVLQFPGSAYAPLLMRNLTVTVLGRFKPPRQEIEMVYPESIQPVQWSQAALDMFRLFLRQWPNDPNVPWVRHLLSAEGEKERSLRTDPRSGQGAHY